MLKLKPIDRNSNFWTLENSNSSSLIVVLWTLFYWVICTCNLILFLEWTDCPFNCPETGLHLCCGHPDPRYWGVRDHPFHGRQDQTNVPRNHAGEPHLRLWRRGRSVQSLRSFLYFSVCIIWWNKCNVLHVFFQLIFSWSKISMKEMHRCSFLHVFAVFSFFVFILCNFGRVYTNKSHEHYTISYHYHISLEETTQQKYLKS